MPTCEVCMTWMGKAKPLPPGISEDALKPLDRRLLCELWARRGTKVSKEILYMLAWDGDPPESRHSLAVHVCWIRKVLGGRYRISNHYGHYMIESV